MEYIYDKVDKDEMIVNFRFDILNNSNSLSVFTIIQFIINNKIVPHKNIFLYQDESHYGIDNIYMGNVYTMLKLSYTFHHYLDEILCKHKYVTNQEFLVYRVNEEIFT